MFMYFLQGKLQLEVKSSTFVVSVPVVVVTHVHVILCRESFSYKSEELRASHSLTTL